ncbi:MULTISPECIES: amidase [Ralstonia solanacearum species complex]|uniref:Asp-tRNAAsn/Glu-tRNAGln amidotransferase A subunit-related amidase n=21 Tax=Ralstonia solanacearum species complex TaxID=3116862 RepID=A0A0S4UPL1_RALSL|nr:amidase [Ralstonia pseudosolanacearum]CUV24122.1 Asp-tRNAAsn/Glu-tRNAGln amidotransferase A subunit-related amidase [Ralstonia solanacearum]CUV32428.1 Asp-tRNAAsn/Glu-tRNAGln amidotransferase A subunit-related amidase [Ralstonia solanacearum]CUV38909.1 Asp-tRNAAsn/Glu-tRNAGln amidotransferase A subunit-related amidase [Ralstonia solanacearum]CUV63465.1 Asp-tRNAAsn/Glu-tRNAGln amidotransferase A subunit-related amidase [Ralstonia solanacearum]
MMTPRPNMIRALAAELAAGHTTSIALTEAALARAQSHRAAGGAAYIDIDARAALDMARAADAARAAGNVPSLLAGLPVSIKDLFDVAGQVTAAGSRALAHQSAATSDATAVARLRAAGAVLLGRTNMSEFAFSGLGLNPHYGTPRTPADGTRAAGGSTSGGAVTVAGGMAVAALGTDTGGSIRIPAAFCALTGFKPTARRVPMAGGVPLSTSLDSGGPLANSVDCCAIVDAVLSGQALDTDAVPLAGLRLGLTRDYVAADLDDTVATAFARAVARLERAGAHIVRFEFPELLQLPEINGGGGLPAAEAWAWHRPHLARAEAQYDRRVAARIRRGEQMSAAAYLDVMAARVRMIAAARKRLGNLDAWLMPTVAVVPPEVAPLETDDARFFHTNARVLRNPSAINFLDGCALTLPIHAAGELPVGLSLCGLADDDARILRVGRAVETALR